MTTFRNALRNGLLLIASLMLALLLGEIMVRSVYEPPSKELPGFRLASSDYYQLDDELGWIPRAGIHGTHVRQRGLTSTFSTNSFGLRDNEHSIEKPQGTKRIVVVGDSFTWGYGVNDGEVFTDVLETMLTNTEVINLGVTAYGLDQETEYFRRLGVRFEPDILIVAFCQNDIFVSGAWRESAFRPPADFRQETVEDTESTSHEDGLFLRLKNITREKSALYGLVIDAVNSNRQAVKLLVWLGLKDSLSGFSDLDGNIMPSLKVYPPTLAASWEEAMTKLRALKALTAESNTRLIVALIPALQSVEMKQLKRSLTYSEFELTDFDVDKPYRALAQFGEEENIEVINPTAAFREATASGEKLYLQWDMHFNARGHALFSSEIAAYLAESAN